MSEPGGIGVALQRGLPLERRPFAVLAAQLGTDEDAVLKEISDLRAAGLVRRFGGVFDTRRLGYRSALCAVQATDGERDALAALVTPLDGVTHCYARTCAGVPQAPSLWFTLSYPADIFSAMADEVSDRLKPQAVSVLPALRRYKVDVVLGGAAQAREEDVTDRLPPLTAVERRIVRALQGDSEVRSDYYAALAESAGVKEWDLLSTLEVWRRNGRLRRIGLLLYHRRAGYAANGMCCWRVAGDTTAAGRALAACGEVTHCYERPPAPGFDYNLYAMIHARTRDEAEAKFALLETGTGLSDGVMMLSTHEYKKTSMRFFQS